MRRPEAPVAVSTAAPFWLARPFVAGETRIIYATARRADADAANAFSAHDVLRAAGCGDALLDSISESDATKCALKIGTANELVIDGMRTMLQARLAQ